MKPPNSSDASTVATDLPALRVALGGHFEQAATPTRENEEAASPNKGPSPKFHEPRDILVRRTNPTLVATQQVGMVEWAARSVDSPQIPGFCAWLLVGVALARESLV
jgi:hypothetical protein